VLPNAGPCDYATCLRRVLQSGSPAALMRDTLTCVLKITRGAICLHWQAIQHSHASHLDACLEGREGPAHSTPAAPEAVESWQIRSTVCCSAAGHIRGTTFRDNFDIVMKYELRAKPDSLVARLEGKLPRAVSSSKSTAGAHGLVKTRQSCFVISLHAIRLLSWTSTCFLWRGPIYVWDRPPCISPTAPPPEKLRPGFPTSFSMYIHL